jgi:4-amino-4-deoxy-L-arabinose transferase-like glycosyltransferase
MRWRLVLVFAAVLLVRLPFLEQAIQGDDVYYLAGAEHAQIDPLHPNHARYPFLGEVVDMRGHPHPPLNTWFLALLLALAGDVYEVPYHAAYLLFSLVAAASMWSLARRFSPQPLAATLLFVATPAFVVNGNSLEADLPLLAFWMASVALFVKAADERSRHWLSGSAVALALAALAAYQAVLIVPVLWVYLWLRARQWWPAWLVAVVPVATLAAWQFYERLSTGALPASVLAGYFHAYGFQALARKVANAAALTAHAGWVVFPVLALVAFFHARRWPWLVEPLLLAAATLGALMDSHLLFWIPFATGLVVVIWSLCEAEAAAAESRFLGAWFLIFFAGAVIVFFAGSARYLLPVAAPLALLVSRALAERARWLWAGVALQALISLGLAAVNYQHWDGYRRFAHSLARETAGKRVWINGEWGLRYYFEAEGGLPLLRGQAVRPGDVVVSSRLALPLEFTTGGGVRAPLAEQEIRSWLPFRLAGLGARSAYSSASFGLRPFDLGTGPIDVVRAELILERKPVLEYLPMSAPEAGQQILSGIHQLESGRWRWMSERGVVLLKPPPVPAPLRLVFFIPDQAPARRIWLAVDGKSVADRIYTAPGSYTLVSEPLTAAGESATVVITVDRTFTVPGDHRRLGVILSEVGFEPVR